MMLAPRRLVSPSGSSPIGLPALRFAACAASSRADTDVPLAFLAAARGFHGLHFLGRRLAEYRHLGEEALKKRRDQARSAQVLRREIPVQQLVDHRVDVVAARRFW